MLFNKQFLTIQSYDRSTIKYCMANGKTGRGYESTMKGEILRER